MKQLFNYRSIRKVTTRGGFFSLLLLFLSTGKLSGQGIEKPNSISHFNEKLFVHTDKSFYVTGEIIWFKIYACNACNNLPDSVSKVAYVELLSPGNRPVLQAKIQLQDGSGSGSLQLPISLNSGRYLFRAYTSWMKNFNVERQFYSAISIVNTFKPAQFDAAADTTKYDVQFFPESGNLISGLQNKVAFKITDVYGRGVSAAGNILDENNNLVTSFSTLRFGMGSFDFTPAGGGGYHAVVTINNTTITALLPGLQQGYLLHIDDNNSELLISARTNMNLQAGTAWLLVQNKHAASFTQFLVFKNGEASVSINKTLLSAGISTFTLLDANHQPVCERLYFKQPAQTFTINASTDKPVYGKRDKITVDVAAAGAGRTNASMAVYMVDSLQNTAINSIDTYLWLSSELKGFIESPEYYLTSNDKDVATATDNLVLTQGWSRFITHDTTADNEFNFLPEYEGHIITGKVTEKRTGQGVPGIVVYLSVPGKNFRFAVAVSSLQGLIRFNVPAFIGSDEIVVQTDQTIDSTYRIDIFSPFSGHYADLPIHQLPIGESLQKQLLLRSISSQVLNTYYNDQQSQFLIPDLDSLPFFGSPDKKYRLDDYTRFTTMEEVLREYVPEIAPRKHRENFRLEVANKQGVYFDENPLVLVDGVPFFNMDTVISFDPLKIKSLSVMKNQYYYGPLSFYGLVSYATYKGDLDGVNLDPNSLVMEYDGMQLQREFYSPRYETKEERNSRLPDFRNTIFWEPNLLLNANEKKQESFYSSDLPGNYLIVINALTKEGKATTKTLPFQVQ